MKFLASSKKNPCPICNSTSGCKTTDKGVLCRHEEGEVEGYKNCGKTTSGLWTRFLTLTDEAPTPRNFPEAVVTAEPPTLAPVDRDFWYKKILNDLSLNEAHRDTLLSKGLTLEAIENTMFRSVTPYQALSFDLPELLPGRANQPNKLMNRDSGFLCPLRNVEGLITGLQIRFDVATGDGRYAWLSSEGRSKNLEGGSPLSIFLNGDNWGLVEGTGVKPLKLSQDRGLSVIGAASGHFANSLTELKRTIALKKISLVTFFPDAGGLKNQHVANRDISTLAMLEELGLKVEVAFWGQLDKEDGDIDEISLDVKLLMLLPSEYKEMAMEYAPSDEAKTRIAKKRIPMPSKTAKAKKVINIEVSEAPVKKSSGSAPEAMSPTETKQWELWKRLKMSYTPTHEFDSQGFIDFSRDIAPVLQPLTEIKELRLAVSNGDKSAETSQKIETLRASLITLVALRSGLGTGKSYSLKALIILLKEAGLIDFVIAPLSTNALGRQLAQDIGATHIHDVVTNDLLGVPGGLVLCLDSFLRLSPAKLKSILPRTLIILDEVTGTQSHLVKSSTLRDRRTGVMSVYSEVLKGAGFVIALDGFLNDTNLRVLKELRDCGESFHAMDNQFSGNEERSVQLFIGHAASGFQRKIKEYLLAKPTTESVPIGTDSLNSAKKLHKLVLEVNPKFKVKTITGQNNSTRANQFYVTSGGEEFFDVIIYTPALQSGVSFLNKEVEVAFFCFYGVIESNLAAQMLRRYRAAKTFFVYCTKSVNWKSEIGSEAGEILKAQLELIKADTEDMESQTPREFLLRKLDEYNESSLGRYDTDITVARNYEYKNTGKCLHQTLESQGYKMTVTDACADSVLSEFMQRASRENYEEEAKATIEAPDITFGEAEQLDSALSLDEEQRATLRRFSILNAFPGLEKTYIWDVKNLADFLAKERELRGASIARTRLLGIEDEAIRTKVRLSRYEQSQKHIVDCLEGHFAKTKLRKDLLLDQFIGLGVVSDSDELFLEFVALLKSKNMKTRLKNVLGVEVGSKTPMRVLGELLKTVGTKLSAQGNGNNRRYSVGLTHDSLALLFSITSTKMAAIATKYRKDEEIKEETIVPKVRDTKTVEAANAKTRAEWESEITSQFAEQNVTAEQVMAEFKENPLQIPVSEAQEPLKEVKSTNVAVKERKPMPPIQAPDERGTPKIYDLLDYRGEKYVFLFFDKQGDFYVFDVNRNGFSTLAKARSWVFSEDTIADEFVQYLEEMSNHIY